MTREEAIKNVIAYAYLNCAELPKEVYLAFDVLVNTSKGIDKAIEEIKELYTEWENSTDDARLESNPFGAVLNIIQRNIGE